MRRTVLLVLVPLASLPFGAAQAVAIVWPCIHAAWEGSLVFAPEFLNSGMTMSAATPSWLLP